MANLPLAFAEILAGGVLLTAGITGDAIGDVMKGQAKLKAKPLAGSSGASKGSPSRSISSPSGGASVNGAAYGKLKGAGGVTPPSFATALLTAIGAPITKANVKSLVDWQAMEGGNWENTAHYNPLNTTLNEPGATSMNSVGVKSYTSWKQGLAATVATLDSHDYADIIAALKSGGGLSGDIPGLSIWSGGGYSSVN